jgi:hypothetical protein
MSKVDEASWITISITLTPDDIFVIEDAIADLEYCGEVNTVVILEHIVQQYKLQDKSRKEVIYILGSDHEETNTKCHTTMGGERL